MVAEKPRDRLDILANTAEARLVRVRSKAALYVNCHGQR